MKEAGERVRYRREFVNFLLFDYEGVEAHLEKMAAKARAEQELAFAAIEKEDKVSATRCIFSRNIKWVYINRNGDYS